MLATALALVSVPMTGLVSVLASALAFARFVVCCVGVAVFGVVGYLCLSVF